MKKPEGEYESDENDDIQGGFDFGTAKIVDMKDNINQIQVAKD